MGVFTKLSKKQIQSLLTHFPDVPDEPFDFKGIGLGTVNTYYRIQQTKQAFFLKIDEVADLKRLQNEIAIFALLNKHHLSFEVPQPLRAPKKAFLPYQKKYALVFPEVAGRSLFQGLRCSHIFQMGQKLAELHKLPLEKNIKNHRFNIEGLKKSFKSIQKPLKAKHPLIAAEMNQILKKLNQEHPTHLKSHLIHGDLFPENVHWQHGQFCGMLDFEAAGRGSSLYDLGVAIHALTFKKKGLNLDKLKALFKGYQSVRPLSGKEKQFLPHFFRLTNMRFLITRLKDFELTGASNQAENFKDYTEYWKRHQNLDHWTELVTKAVR